MATRRVAKRRRKTQSTATFVRLPEIRDKLLHWDVADIVSRLPGHRPSASSIYRLEQGLAIRTSNARRVFDVVNTALNNTLDPRKELKVTRT
jgi:hypothetical protein